MIRTRLITAAIAIPVLILAILKLPPMWFAALLAIVAALALAEFLMMYNVPKSVLIPAVLLGGAVVIGKQAGYFANVLLISFFIVVTLRLFMKREPHGALNDIAPVIFGLLYIPGLLSLLIPLRREDPFLIIMLLAMVWGGDAVAYFVGKSIGKRKLYVSMSPNKTWAGAIGSVLGGAGVAVILQVTVLKWIPIEQAAICGVIIGAVTVVGDLVESMLKRDAGIKDSGAWIPGHGGVLDKLDGSIYAGPALYWLLISMGLIPRGLFS
ncbi:phosphatidate cytidylyltransferase [Nitrospirota bacterium]